MTLEAQIANDLKTAMKAKDQVALRSIRAIKAAILLAKTSGDGKEFDEASEIKLLQKLVKQRQESLVVYEKQNREDLAKGEREEIEIISRYMPEALSEDELSAIVKSVIEKTGASSMKDMGKVMGMVTQEVAGRADGKTISGIVRQLLA